MLLKIVTIVLKQCQQHQKISVFQKNKSKTKQNKENKQKKRRGGGKNIGGKLSLKFSAANDKIFSV